MRSKNERFVVEIVTPNVVALITDATLVVQIEHSVRHMAMCVRTMNFKRNGLLPRYFA